MNIKQMIDAGMYPKDDKGRPLVPMKNGKVLIVLATDKKGQFPIVGMYQENDIQVTDNFAVDSDRLFPSEPRKVKAPDDILLGIKDGKFYGTTPVAAYLPKYWPGCTMVRLPDELEEYIPGVEQDKRCKGEPVMSCEPFRRLGVRAIGATYAAVTEDGAIYKTYTEGEARKTKLGYGLSWVKLPGILDAVSFN